MLDVKSVGSKGLRLLIDIRFGIIYTRVIESCFNLSHMGKDHDYCAYLMALLLKFHFAGQG